MSIPEFDRLTSKGVLRPNLFVGVVSSVTARGITVNLSAAGRPSGAHYEGGRYGRGEVGEFVLVEGQQSLLLGRVAEVRLLDAERRAITPSFAGKESLEAFGRIDLLGHVSMHTLAVTAGVDAYPRLGDRIFAAPHSFIAMLPSLMESRLAEEPKVTLHLGSVDGAQESPIKVKPERLFGRHCAILGATGGGKSWTTARIIEECIQHNCKIILLDATGEYRGFEGDGVVHCHLGEPVEKAKDSLACVLPPNAFSESDFVAMFEPSGKVQGPKLRAAIQSLRLAKLEDSLADANGLIVKAFKDKSPFEQALQKHAAAVNDPREPFNVRLLAQQIVNECVQDYEPSKWKAQNDQEVGYCSSLLTRINGVLSSKALDCVFGSTTTESLTGNMDEFVSSGRLFRIDLSSVPYEFNAREVVANAVGRHMLTAARDGRFLETPTVIFVDEAHNFLGRHLGGEDYSAKLDAFELIAKEGRKYGLNICLASQRPRDITEGVLSQMGTLIVHRLTNDRDREVVERACGEIDRAASAFLPNLQPGEAAIIGTDFPIPLTIRIEPPNCKPKSDGPDFQERWAKVSHEGHDGAAPADLASIEQESQATLARMCGEEHVSNETEEA